MCTLLHSRDADGDDADDDADGDADALWSVPPACADDPADWKDSEGRSCEVYQDKALCASDGEYGPGWSKFWGTFGDFAVNGVAAPQACCACGKEGVRGCCGRGLCWGMLQRRLWSRDQGPFQQVGTTAGGGGGLACGRPVDGLWTEARGQQKQSNDPGNNQHILNTPTIGRR